MSFTDEVYDDLPLDRPVLFFTETTNLHTSSPYSASKASEDKNCRSMVTALTFRDWLYVEDHCAAINLILEKGKVGEVYNIGGHNERANIDVVKTILKQLGKSEDLIEYVGDRKGHDRRYAIDLTKIHNELGWLPETKFEDGIKATVQWYLDNRQWWEGIINRMN